MQRSRPAHRNPISRRAILAATAAIAASPVLAEECRIGPPPHAKGQPVFLEYDQVELDAAYDQRSYEPLMMQVSQRLASNSEATRARIGAPQRAAYGPSEIEKLDIYRAGRANAPVFVYIHGGTWRWGSAADSGFAAEMFVNAGAHYVALDFSAVTAAGGDLGVLAAQVRRAIGWVYNNAESFGADRNRLYIGGHSSGGHLCGVALATEWRKEFGIPDDAVKGGLCMSGMYELAPVRLSWRKNYINFTDAMTEAMSPQRHVGALTAPIVVTYGSFETPEFQRQSRDFAAAVKAGGKPVTLVEAQNYAHLEMAESLGNPYGPNGRAALAMMQLAPGRS
jgi:arylformamidase